MSFYHLHLSLTSGRQLAPQLSWLAHFIQPTEHASICIFIREKKRKEVTGNEGRSGCQQQSLQHCLKQQPASGVTTEQRWPDPPQLYSPSLRQLCHCSHHRALRAFFPQEFNLRDPTCSQPESILPTDQELPFREHCKGGRTMEIHRQVRFQPKKKTNH